MEGRFVTLSKRQFALVLTVNESGSSFRFTIPKFNLDLHLPSTGAITHLIKMTKSVKVST